MLHGKTIIELQDSKTGKVDRFVDHNLVTVGIPSYFNDNPYGAAHRFMFSNITSIPSSSFTSLPPQTGAIGGIALFDKRLTENTKPWFEFAPISYASADSYAGANVERGQLNSGLSTILSNGYRWVYDFGTERANHTFKALGLTSRMCGRGPAGTDVTNQLVGEFNNTGDAAGSFNRNGYGFVVSQVPNGNYNLVLAAFDDTFYCAQYGTGNTFNLYECYAPSRFGWNFRDTRTSSTTVQQTAELKNTYTLTNGWIAVDQQNKTIYTLVNSGNSSGNASITIHKYEYPNFVDVSSTITVSAPLKASQKMCSIAIVDGYIYMPAYNNGGVYKINISTPSDILYVPFGTTISSNTGTAAVGKCVAVDTGIIFPDGTFWRTNRASQHPYTPFNVIPFSDNSVWGMSRWFGGNTSGSYAKFSVAPCDFYLATKNNLDSEITKTTAQTMRITYELTTT